jgi:hypothetical protein
MVEESETQYLRGGNQKCSIGACVVDSSKVLCWSGLLASRERKICRKGDHNQFRLAVDPTEKPA